MALSEDEQRILRQIEQELQNDSKFAQAVSPSGLYTHSAKTVRLAAIGLVLGLVLAIHTNCHLSVTKVFLQSFPSWKQLHPFRPLLQHPPPKILPPVL